MQDSTKDGSGGGDRRNWRERLGVGQDLPKISDEFKLAEADSKRDGQSGPKPGAPVRPAPMAPRITRPAAAPADAGQSRVEPPAARHTTPAAPTPRSLAPAHQSSGSFRQQRPTGPAGWPSAGHGQPAAIGAQRPGFASRSGTPTTPPRSAPPSRGPAANAHAGRSGTTPTASGGDSFGERLRAQREAAERLAQQRLAAAREKSGRASTETRIEIGPHKLAPAPQPEAAAQPKPQDEGKPAGGEQPRFTFAQEEIIAAQRETEPDAQDQPAAAGQTGAASPSPGYTPPEAHARVEASTDRQAQAGRTPDRLPPPYVPPQREAGEYRPGADADRHPDLGYISPNAAYRHDDEAMFEDEPPGGYAAPPRASAADYSAAYREFEDEFEEEPRRRGGPLLLLLSLLAVAVVSGGVIYWYQQLQRSPAPATADLPVITAPEESVKADPEPVLQPQAAVQPTRRKQIYDRILGQETLEPERIVPTEEEPQLQMQQPPQPRASGADQGQSPAPAGQQSTEPLPLPLPPPPGTGEQGDLLVPGMADTEVASAAPEPAQLALPAPVAQPARASEPTQRTAGEAASNPVYPELKATLPYGAPSTPLPYDTPATAPAEADVASQTAAPKQAREPVEAAVAALPEPHVEAEPQREPDPEPESEPQVAAEPDSEVPLPRTKPEPPPGVRTVTRTPPPQPQPQRRQAAPAQPSGSGPVQITPTVLAPDQAPAAQPQPFPQPEAQQPAVEPAPLRTRPVGREDDPLDGHRSPFSGSPVSGAEAPARQLTAAPQPATPALEPAPEPEPAPQRVASVAPDPAPPSQSEGAGGYVVQLASFRSETEAQDEYQRLAQRHPNLVGGLRPRVQQASLGQSGTFYRLGVGPLTDRMAATKLCNDLIAAGEKDCLVRQN